jgi:hypothetical protein
METWHGGRDDADAFVSSGGSLIASGKLTLKGERSLDQIGPGFGYATEAMVPVEVKVTWNLTRL